LSDAKARIAQALNGGEEDWYQSQFLPIKTRKGEWDWGVPGMIQAPWDAWKREYDSAWGIGPGVTQDQQIEDAMSIAGLMAGGGVGGVPKGALGTFGGRLAVTADKQALAKAEEMAAAGIPREQIWTETGWFQGVDGKWRFEINDSGAEYLGGAGANPQRLDQYLDHPDLQSAYPQIMETSTRELTAKEKSFANAGFNPYRNEFILDRAPFSDPAKSSTLHEVQHAIQQAEGFAAGSNERLALRDAWRELPGVAQAKDNVASVEATSPKGLSRLNPIAWVRYDQNLVKALEAESAAMRKYAGPGLRDIASAYERSAGEVESRTVQKRMNMTPRQRQARPPWLDDDVPAHRQIVRALLGK
jgi:hypothetical protein